MPDALRWLWSGYPKPVGTSQNPRGPNQQPPIIEPGQGWQLVARGIGSASALAADGQGNVFISGPAANRIYEISPDRKVRVFLQHSGGAGALSFGPENLLYACMSSPARIAAFDPGGKESVITQGVRCKSLAVTAHGAVYFPDSRHGQIGYIPPDSRFIAYREIPNVDVLTVSPDQSLLIAGSVTSRWLWSFQIQSGGSLADGEPFYGLEDPEEPGMRGARGLTTDTEGYIYALTPLGIQVCDQPGRVVSILEKPGEGKLSAISFGGPGLHELYVIAGGKIYRRTLARRGALSASPEKPPVPHL